MIRGSEGRGREGWLVVPGVVCWVGGCGVVGRRGGDGPSTVLKVKGWRKS